VLRNFLVSSPDVFDHLERFGLSDTEAQIYHHLIHHQSQSVLRISRELRIPRTSIYDNSQKLLEKGLVERVFKGSTQRLKALPPLVLEDSLKKQQQTLKDLEGSYQFLKKALRPEPDPELEFTLTSLLGRDGVETVFRHSLESTSICLYDNLTLDQAMPFDYYKIWIKGVKQRQIALKIIAHSDTDTLIRAQKQIRLLNHFSLDQIKLIDPERLANRGIQLIYAGTTAYVYVKGEDARSIEIKNSVFAGHHQQLFDQLWQSAKPLYKALPDKP